MLRIENIKKTFNPGTINEKIALDGVDLKLLLSLVLMVLVNLLY